MFSCLYGSLLTGYAFFAGMIRLELLSFMVPNLEYIKPSINKTLDPVTPYSNLTIAKIYVYPEANPAAALFNSLCKSNTISSTNHVFCEFVVARCTEKMIEFFYANSIKSYFIDQHHFS